MGLDRKTFEAVDAFVEETLVEHDEALLATLNAAEAAGLPQIQVSPPQGKLLQMLARLRGARTVLEFGTLGGYSTILLARALPEGGRLVTLEANAEYAEVARASIERAGVGEIVDLRPGPALETLAAWSSPTTSSVTAPWPRPPAMTPPPSPASPARDARR